MDNIETLATSGNHRATSGNIGHTGHRTKTNKQPKTNTNTKINTQKTIIEK
jgi:hypothetical protein